MSGGRVGNVEREVGDDGHGRHGGCTVDVAGRERPDESLEDDRRAVVEVASAVTWFALLTSTKVSFRPRARHLEGVEDGRRLVELASR